MSDPVDQPANDAMPGWEAFVDSGIPEIVARMFPAEPRLEDFRRSDGTPDPDSFEDAHDEWRDTCLTLAYEAARLPETLERVARTGDVQTESERVRDAVIDLLERDPLPVEPVKDDYLVRVAPSYEGEFEQMRFAWDHSQWRADFTAAARRRDQVLRTLIDDGAPRTTFLPEQFARTWIPADLIAVHTLRALVDVEHPAHWEPLAQTQRDLLAKMLVASDPEVRVPDPDDPGGPELFTGEASDAHRWLPAGVYEATGADESGSFRLVVGPVAHEDTASAAFAPEDHDSAVLAKIALILEQDTADQDSTRILARVNDAVRETGRVAASPSDFGFQDPPMTQLEQGVILGEFLAERERDLTTRPDDDTPGPPRSEPRREL